MGRKYRVRGDTSESLVLVLSCMNGNRIRIGVEKAEGEGGVGVEV